MAPPPASGFITATGTVAATVDGGGGSIGFFHIDRVVVVVIGMSPMSLATTATTVVVLMVTSVMATVRSHVALEEIASFRQLSLRVSVRQALSSRKPKAD